VPGKWPTWKNSGEKDFEDAASGFKAPCGCSSAGRSTSENSELLQQSSVIFEDTLRGGRLSIPPSRNPICHEFESTCVVLLEVSPIKCDLKGKPKTVKRSFLVTANF